MSSDRIMTMEQLHIMATPQPSAGMPSSLAATSPRFETEPINASIQLYECYPGGDVLLIMSRCAGSESMSEYDRLGDASDADDDINASLKALFAEETDEERRDTAIQPTVFHFRVSSQCMILASPVFRAMLQGAFKESLKLHSIGELRLPLPDDDPDNFLILLDILHLRNKKVPRLVSLSRLTKLAILVDKYQMQESVEVFSDMWIIGLQGRKCDVPARLTPDVIPWLFISWVFQKEKQFRQTTKILQREGNAAMEESSLPEVSLPGLVIAQLQNDRCIALEEIFHTIASHIREYQEPDTISQRLCQRPEDLKALACDAMVLGTLLKGSIKAGILPIPAYPYHGFTVRQLVSDVAALEICSLCEINKDGMYGRYRGNQWKEVHDKVKRSMLSFKDSFEAAMDGLDLNDFI